MATKETSAIDYVAFAVPWVALGPKKLFGDSGFLTLYEPLCNMFKRHGTKSVMFLNRNLKEAFEDGNDPEETGVYGVYSDTVRNRGKTADQPVSDWAVNEYIDCKRPIDFILTNKQHLVQHLASQAAPSMAGTLGPPVIYACINAGGDGVVDPTGLLSKTVNLTGGNFKRCRGIGVLFNVFVEGVAYLTADYIIWTTEYQRKRGMKIARRLLAPSEVKRLEERSMPT